MSTYINNNKNKNKNTEGPPFTRTNIMPSSRKNGKPPVYETDKYEHAESDDEDDDAQSNVRNDGYNGTGQIRAPQVELDLQAELDEKYPNRPVNLKPTLPFHVLYQTLFDPLAANIKKKATGPKVVSRKQIKPHDVRRRIIERFISRWREEVGDDIYPAFRLIMPDKDRDRTVYGLKEKALASQLVKVLGISKNSDDAQSLINWKVPKAGGGTAGDFPSKCFDAILKRPMRIEPGSMTIAEVNHLLDELAKNQKEEHQLPIIRKLYEHMNAEEMQWIIRIILKQMRVGATEKTFFECWHPDGYNLFNVSSQLKRVCWELYDPNFRLNADEKGVTLMQCFQPQLAQFQQSALETIIKKMRPEGDDKMFWIEEKLDGERMQLHMDNGQFKFWSRKAKDYTYLYGQAFDTPDSSLTKHIKSAFRSGVQSCILDGEMITWNPKEDAMVPFGTLKTAALDQQRHDDPTGNRPLYRVFDMLYLNGLSLINYTLRDRRNALMQSLESVHRRLEIHDYKEASTEEEINRELGRVVAEASEGLVIKNPRSWYQLGERNDDWIKVKPEYMVDHGEDLDCLVIGAYWGSGRRGGRLSSFLCGLRVDGIYFTPGDEHKFISFFKVGGGFSAADYSKIDNLTEGKWHDWDRNVPSKKEIELATNGTIYFEKPDVWIKPEDSFVVSVKAASIANTDQFKTGLTLRFPRFKEIKEERSWANALSITEFLSVRERFNERLEEKKFQVDVKRRKQSKKKRELMIAGGIDPEQEHVEHMGTNSSLFYGMKFFVATDSTSPRKTKNEIEHMIRAHGGEIYQSETAHAHMTCVADKDVIRVRSLKRQNFDILRPLWIVDCINNNFLLPYEPGRHIFHSASDSKASVHEILDCNGDSFIRNLSVDELEKIIKVKNRQTDMELPHWRDIVKHFQHQEFELEDLPTWMFKDSVIYIDTTSSAEKNGIIPSSQVSTSDHSAESLLRTASNIVRFAAGHTSDNFEDLSISHILVSENRSRLALMREKLSRRKTIPRIVSVKWVEESWAERTLLDAERYLAL